MKNSPRRRRPPNNHPGTPAAAAAALFDHHPSLRLLRQCNTPATVKQVHANMVTTGLALHTYPLSRLLLSSSASSTPLGPSYAITILRHFPRPTTFLYNTLISSLLLAAHHHLHHHLAWSLYSELAAHPTLRPNSHTYPSLLRACGTHHHGLALHAHVLKFLGNTHDHFVQAALLNLYSRCGKISVCRHLFDQIPHPDLATWNSILSAYSRTITITTGSSSNSNNSSDAMEALFLFHEMQHSLTRPNEITLVAVIGACGNLGSLGQGMWVHAYVEKNRHVVMNHFVGTALIDMYGKCGCLDLAMQVFDSLPVKDTHCYNTMIHGFAVHGRGHRAVELFERMRSDGVCVDDVTLVVVICACAHAGLVNEGHRCFNDMVEVFGIEPKVEHYGCLVDLLGRAGRVEEAEEVVWRMPMEPNVVLYRSLLGACRIYNKFEIVERVIGHLMELEPGHGGNYVLLSNMYANIEKWEDVRKVRKLMKDKGVCKDHGCSLIEINGTMHEFVMGDKTHPHSKEIYAMLDEMVRRLCEHGHRPSTKEVLFDVEEDKEDALSYHSERLAIDRSPLLLLHPIQVPLSVS